MSTEHTEGRRYLGAFETYFEVLNQGKYPHSIFYNVTKFTTKKDVMTEDKIRKAFLMLASHHSMLHSKLLTNDDGDYYFEEMIFSDTDPNWIPLKIVTDKNDFNWEAILREEKKIGFTDILWRAIWLSNEKSNEHTLILICSHSIMDAKGGFDIIVNQLLGNCFNNMNGGTASFKKPVLLTKPIEVLCGARSLPISQQECKWYVRTFINMYVWAMQLMRSNKPKIRTYEVEQGDVNSSFHHFIVDEQQLTKLVQFCKRNNVTVHCILSIIYVRALKETQKRYCECTDDITDIDFPIDARKFFDATLCHSPMPCGLFTFPADLHVPIVDFSNRENFMDVAKKVNKNIISKNDITNAYHISLLTAMLKRKDSYKCFENLGDPPTVSFSNLGNCELLKQSSVEEGNMFLIQEHYYGATAPTGALVLSTLTLCKQMFFTVCYDTNWLSKDFAVLLGDNIIKYMKTVCEID